MQWMRPRDNRGRFSKSHKTPSNELMSREKRPRSSEGKQDISQPVSPSISPASKRTLAEDTAAWRASPGIQNDFYPQYLRRDLASPQATARKSQFSPIGPSENEGNGNNNSMEKLSIRSLPSRNTRPPGEKSADEDGSRMYLSQDQSESFPNNSVTIDDQSQNLPSREGDTHGAYGSDDTNLQPLGCNDTRLASLQSRGAVGHDNVIVLSNSNGLPISTVDLEGVMTRVMANVMGKLDSMSTDLKQVPIIKAATAKLDRELIQVRQDFHGMKESVHELSKKEEDNSSKQKELEEEVRAIKSELQHRASNKTEGEFHDNQSSEMVSLKKEATARKMNLIIEGIEEPKGDQGVSTAVSQIKSFFTDALHLPEFEIATAFRLGKPRQLALRPRPIKVLFLQPADRDAVWRAKAVLTRNRDFKYSIKEDLPPKLRAQMSALIRVSQIARRYPELYQNVWINDFQIHINGSAYAADQLESLPSKLRPSVSSTPGNTLAVVFYGRDSKFSNHFPCTFTWDNMEFSSVEQYLAFRRATIAKRKDLAQQVRGLQDPVDAKRIMNSLKSSDAEPQWIERRKDILFSGLMAKFSQNEYLMRYLLASGQRKLGEASLDKDWGIGMSLTDRLVLDPTKWVGDNLLGVTLMEVREELNSWTHQDKSLS